MISLSIFNRNFKFRYSSAVNKSVPLIGFRTDNKASYLVKMSQPRNIRSNRKTYIVFGIVASI